MAQTLAQLIETVFEPRSGGTLWNSADGEAKTLKIYFGFAPDFPVDYTTGIPQLALDSSNVKNVESEQIIALLSILETIEQYSKIKFEFGEVDNSDIYFWNSNVLVGPSGTPLAGLVIPRGNNGAISRADVFFNSSIADLSETALQPSGASYQLHIHEVLHALGLKHPDEGGGTFSPPPYALYEQQTEYPYTVMRSAGTNADVIRGVYAQTPMIGSQF